MTALRLASATTPARCTTVERGMAEFLPRSSGSVSRPIRSMPSLRPVEPPSYPSRRDVLRRWEDEDVWQCTYCDVAAGPKVVLEVDHVLPLAKGGRHIWENLTPACTLCNRAKGSTDVDVWQDVSTGQGSTDRGVSVTQGSGKPFHATTQDLHNVTTA
ncbi:HNH endonuclease signature motif containing protein [Streptomyces silvensis]|uniref:HNH endonuclease n=1 Tax=Streptomyces silvensis TaxID=1765722 RepID=UPI00099E599F